MTIKPFEYVNNVVAYLLKNGYERKDFTVRQPFNRNVGGYCDFFIVFHGPTMIHKAHNSRFTFADKGLFITSYFTPAVNSHFTTLSFPPKERPDWQECYNDIISPWESNPAAIAESMWEVRNLETATPPVSPEEIVLRDIENEVFSEEESRLIADAETMPFSSSIVFDSHTEYYSFEIFRVDRQPNRHLFQVVYYYDKEQCLAEFQSEVEYPSAESAVKAGRRECFRLSLWSVKNQAAMLSESCGKELVILRVHPEKSHTRIIKVYSEDGWESVKKVYDESNLPAPVVLAIYNQGKDISDDRTSQE